MPHLLGRRALHGGSAAACALIITLSLAAALPAGAQSAFSGDTIAIAKTADHITIDGALDEDAWRKATRIDKWYETNVGDNVEPQVHNVGYLMYDGKYLYAGFEFDDPSPNQ